MEKGVQVFKAGDQNGTWIFSITVWRLLHRSHLMLTRLYLFKRKLLSLKSLLYAATVPRLTTPLSQEQRGHGNSARETSSHKPVQRWSSAAGSCFQGCLYFPHLAAAMTSMILGTHWVLRQRVLKVTGLKIQFTFCPCTPNCRTVGLFELSVGILNVQE